MEQDAAVRERALVLFDLAWSFVVQKRAGCVARLGGGVFRASGHGFTVYCSDKGPECQVDIWPHWKGVRVQRSAYGRRKLFSARKRVGGLWVVMFKRGPWEDEFLALDDAGDRANRTGGKDAGSRQRQRAALPFSNSTIA